MNTQSLALDSERPRPAPSILHEHTDHHASGRLAPSALAASPLRGAPCPVVYDAAMLQACLAGDPKAMRAVVDDLTPVIQSRAARALLRRTARGHRRNLAQEVQELTQEVFLCLFADGARVLRSWDVSRGLSLRNFVGLVAEREIADVLQSGRRRPWNERCTAEEPTDEEIGAGPPLEAKVEARELFAMILVRLREELSPQGFDLFEMLLVDDRPVEDACAATGMSRDAIYAWRSRLHKTVRRIADSLTG
jgi:RNA polymerase sigma factor (sigma-70 family)